MLAPSFTGPFKKDRKLLKKQNKNIEKLNDVMNMIINEQPLPPERYNHPLKGEWKNSYGCHIQGDWVLIYEPEHKTHTVIFHRTGSHSELY